MPIPNNSAQLRTARVDLALDTPSGGAKRLLALPGTIASPPAIVVTTAAFPTWPASSIVGAVAVSITSADLGSSQTRPPSAVFRLTGNGGQFSAFTPGDPNTNYDILGIPASQYTNQMVIDFMFDGQNLEYAFGSKGVTYALRMMVDGNYISTTPTSMNAVNQQGYAFVNFGSRAVRRITVEADPSSYHGVNIGPNDTVWYPSHIPYQPKVFVVGDSFCGTTAGGPAIVHDVWWGWVGRRLGWNIWGSGGSGTGYTNPGSIGGTIRTRVNQLASFAPDVWILCGGVNDGGATSAAETAEAILTFQAAKANNPNSKLIVVGPWGSANPAGATRTATRDAVLAAVNSTGTLVDAFIDPIALNFITGTGRIGATTGTGNADLYISSDGIHPSTAGHFYLGDRMAQQLAAVIDSGVLL